MVLEAPAILKFLFVLSGLLCAMCLTAARNSALENNALGDIWLARICSLVLAGIVYFFPLERASFLPVSLDIEKIPKLDNDEYCIGETM